MQNFNKRISEIEKKMSTHFLKESDYAYWKFIKVMNKQDKEKYDSLIDARDSISLDKMDPLLVKKYAKDIKKYELSEIEKQFFANVFNKAGKELSSMVNKYLEKT
jgi:hypothetical protein